MIQTSEAISLLLVMLLVIRAARLRRGTITFRLAVARAICRARVLSGARETDTAPHAPNPGPAGITVAECNDLDDL
jgi:hypothetical protein